MIYVVGVGHKIEQFPHDMNDLVKVEKFKKFIERVSREKKVGLIAEEWCDDARFNSLTRKTYAEEFALAANIHYSACDPGQQERATLGILGRDKVAAGLGLNVFAIQPDTEEERCVNEAAAEGDRRREQFWMDKLAAAGAMEKNVIFVSGYGHADEFVALLNSNGWDAGRIYID